MRMGFDGFQQSQRFTRTLIGKPGTEEGLDRPLVAFAMFQGMTSEDQNGLFCGTLALLQLTASSQIGVLFIQVAPYRRPSKLCRPCGRLDLGEKNPHQGTDRLVFLLLANEYFDPAGQNIRTVRIDGPVSFQNSYRLGPSLTVTQCVVANQMEGRFFREIME